MDDGAYAEAANYFERAAAEDPTDPKCWWSLGVAALKANQVARAREAFTQVALLKPKEPLPRIRIGFTWELERNYDEAEKAYRLAVTIAPRSGEARRVLGTRLLRWGRPDEAVAPLAEAVRLEPSHAEGWNALALARHASGDIRGAEATFLSGIAKLPDARQLYIGHAALLLQEKRLTDALAVYNAVVQRWPTYAPAHLGRAILLHELGARAQAERAYESAANVAKNPAPYQKRLADYRKLRGAPR